MAPRLPDRGAISHHGRPPSIPDRAPRHLPGAWSRGQEERLPQHSLEVQEIQEEQRLVWPAPLAQSTPHRLPSLGLAGSRGERGGRGAGARLYSSHQHLAAPPAPALPPAATRSIVDIISEFNARTEAAPDWGSLRREVSTFKPLPREQEELEVQEEPEVEPEQEVERRKLSGSESCSSGECGPEGRREGGKGREEGSDSPDTDSGCDMSVMVNYLKEPRSAERTGNSI